MSLISLMTGCVSCAEGGDPDGEASNAVVPWPRHYARKIQLKRKLHARWNDVDIFNNETKHSANHVSYSLGNSRHDLGESNSLRVTGESNSVTFDSNSVTGESETTTVVYGRMKFTAPAVTKTKPTGIRRLALANRRAQQANKALGRRKKSRRRVHSQRKKRLRRRRNKLSKKRRREKIVSLRERKRIRRLRKRLLSDRNEVPTTQLENVIYDDNYCCIIWF